ncbi:hypothetical protein SK128_010959, partial [Halocaridina rubra]
SSCVCFPASCSDGFYNSTYGCVPSFFLCQGWFGDFSDIDCNITCDGDYFQCSDATCIHKVFKCDGYQDCSDDEINCG